MTGISASGELVGLQLVEPRTFILSIGRLANKARSLASGALKVPTTIRPWSSPVRMSLNQLQHYTPLHVKASYVGAYQDLHALSRYLRDRDIDFYRGDPPPLYPERLRQPIGRIGNEPLFAVPAMVRIAKSQAAVNTTGDFY